MKTLKQCVRTSIVNNFDENQLAKICWSFFRVEQNSENKLSFHPFLPFYEMRGLLFAKMIKNYHEEYERAKSNWFLNMIPTMPCYLSVKDEEMCALKILAIKGMPGDPINPEQPERKANTTHKKLHELCIEMEEINLYVSELPDNLLDLVGKKPNMSTDDREICEKFYNFYMSNYPCSSSSL